MKYDLHILAILMPLILLQSDLQLVVVENSKLNL